MNCLYCKMAVTNLKNNRKFYVPYILVGVVSAAMFYIMRAIQENEGIGKMRGSATLEIVLTLGLVIVGICVCIFLFYTNSFVMKRRKKELGVYNILGMEKKHIAKVMVWEAVILYGICVGGGLVFGIVFHKLVAMFLYKLTGLSEKIPFSVFGWGCLQTAELFGMVYVLMLLYNFLQVKLANPITLLHGSNVGEREPKANWIAAGLGVVCMLTGYYLAVTVRDISYVGNMFFVAVIFVIAGTYALFISVSIAVLKLLKKNKKYYYQTTHFITVSGMLYRMKRNAVGLASICVLSTMVLVMISTTTCLYIGMEDFLQKEYETEFRASLYFENVPDAAARGYLMEQVDEVAKQQNRKMTQVSEYADVPYITYNEGNKVEHYDNKDGSFDYTYMGALYVMTKKDYETYTGEVVSEIAPGNVTIVSLAEFEWDTIIIFGKEYQISEKVLFSGGSLDKEIGKILDDRHVLYAIVPDDSQLDQIRAETTVQYHIGIEIDGTQEERRAFASALTKRLGSCGEQLGFDTILSFSRAEQKDTYMEMNGGFLFLGLFLGSMFLMITVMMIYYKQISEGVEDRERFAIMTKVGMSHDVIKTAILTQMRTVFFMPITVAVIHLAMAFPMLKIMMQIFGLANTSLFVGCLAATTAVFAAIYFLVFRLTSENYYRVVNKR